MKKKGNWGNVLGRMFTGPDESAHSPSERPRSEAEHGDEIETPEDIVAKYGKYLDEDGVPFKGINPKPKYYVVPKEPPKPLPKKATVRKVKKPKPVQSPAAGPEAVEPAPKKVTVKKVKKAKKVTVKKKSKQNHKSEGHQP